MWRFVNQTLARRRVAKLAEAKRICVAAYDAAVRRGDTRRQSETWRDLKAATCELIRAEIALSMNRSKARRRTERVTPSMARGFR